MVLRARRGPVELRSDASKSDANRMSGRQASVDGKRNETLSSASWSSRSAKAVLEMPSVKHRGDEWMVGGSTKDTTAEQTERKVRNRLPPKKKLSVRADKLPLPSAAQSFANESDLK